MGKKNKDDQNVGFFSLENTTKQNYAHHEEDEFGMIFHCLF